LRTVLAACWAAVDEGVEVDAARALATVGLAKG